LLMARGSARQREIGVRLALGAKRARLIRQLLTESLVLGGLGGVLGALIAFAGTKILVVLVSSGYQMIHLPLRPDLRTLGFTAAISLLTTILFPNGFGFGGEQFVHGGSLLFAGATAHIAADSFGREVLCGAMEPAG